MYLSIVVPALISQNWRVDFATVKISAKLWGYLPRVYFPLKWLSSSYIAPFFILSLDTWTKTVEKTAPTKKLQKTKQNKNKNKFFKCFFAPDLLAQNSTRTFLLIKCSRNERLMCPELLISWKPEKSLGNSNFAL